jgi:predicted nucleic-acid-binding protein
MRAIDTNVLVRILVRDEENQVAAAESFTKTGAWISHLVLMEAIWVMDSFYDETQARIASAVEMLLDHRELVVQDGETVRAALVEYRKRPALGFSNCLILEMGRKAGHLPLGTFDRELGKLSGAQKL